MPRQHSTGGRDRLLGISKRGDVYLRNLLIHGARAVLRTLEHKEDRTSLWVKALKARRHTNVAIVAVANKMARVAYAVMTTGSLTIPPSGPWRRRTDLEDRVGDQALSRPPGRERILHSQRTDHHQLRRVNLKVMA